MTPGIYIFTNTADGKQYVGQSIDVEKRVMKHFYDSEKGSTSCRKFYNALRRYGPDAFSITKGLFPESLEDHPQRKLMLDIAEKVCIRILEANLNGYNLTDGGEGGALSEETKRRMSEAHKNSEKARERLARLHADPEFRQKRAEQLARLHASPEHKEHLARLHADPEFQQKRAEQLARLNADPEFQQKRAEHLARLHQSQRKLSPEQVQQVFHLRSQGLLQREIADHFSVSQRTISSILRGELYQDLQ